MFTLTWNEAIGHASEGLPAENLRIYAARQIAYASNTSASDKVGELRGMQKPKT